MTTPTLEELKEMRLGIFYKAMSNYISRLKHSEPELNDDISDVGRLHPPEWSAEVIAHSKSSLLKKDVEFLEGCVERGADYVLSPSRIAWFRDIARKVKREVPIGVE